MEERKGREGKERCSGRMGRVWKHVFFYGEDNDSIGGRQKAWEGKSDLDWEDEGERQHWIGLIFGLSN